MAYRDPDGYLVSADSVDVTIEYGQERIAEENVCYFANFMNCPQIFVMSFARSCGDETTIFFLSLLLLLVEF